jgi:hypothetical protein
MMTENKTASSPRSQCPNKLVILSSPKIFISLLLYEIEQTIPVLPLAIVA